MLFSHEKKTISFTPFNCSLLDFWLLFLYPTVRRMMNNLRDDIFLSNDSSMRIFCFVFFFCCCCLFCLFFLFVLLLLVSLKLFFIIYWLFFVCLFFFVLFFFFFFFLRLLLSSFVFCKRACVCKSCSNALHFPSMLSYAVASCDIMGQGMMKMCTVNVMGETMKLSHANPAMPLLIRYVWLFHVCACVIIISP